MVLQIQNDFSVSRAQALVECGRVRALMHGRYHTSAFEDIEAVAAAVLRHRIMHNVNGHAEGHTPDTVLSAHLPRGVVAHASAA